MDNKKIFSKNLLFFLKQENKTQTEMARDLGYPEMTVSNWINAKTYPRIDRIQEMADYFDILKSDLTEEKDKNKSERTELINNYDKLKKENKTKLTDYSKELIEKEKEENNVVDLYPVETIEKAAAGVGFSYISNEKSVYYTDRNNLAPYDLATVVIGDSMEPKYNSGDVILLKQGYDNINGDIYVIDYDGKTYVKKLYNDGDRYRLISINKKYENIIIDIPIDRDIYFNIVGKVVDSFTPIEL